MELKVGMTNSAAKTVGKDDTAVRYGSGTVEVFATPALVGLMESAALGLAQPYLPQGAATVGVEVSIAHSRATPVGMRVEGTATLTGVEGRRLYFEVVAHDEKGEIGRGTHVRCIVDVEKFMNKL